MLARCSIEKVLLELIADTTSKRPARIGIAGIRALELTVVLIARRDILAARVAAQLHGTLMIARCALPTGALPLVCLVPTACSILGQDIGGT